MKNLHKLLIWILLFFSTNAFSQILYLNAPDNTNTPGSGVLDNRDYEGVDLQPGYDYTAEPGFKMNAFVDHSIVGQINYGSLISQEDFDDYAIDPSLPVGFTPGAAGVSPSGAATYDITIQLPSGTNGMMPSLSISYNSQSGNGMLGMGWNLSGLSVISRVPKTIYHNGKTEAVKFDYTDNFALDGNRLMGITGTYGHNNATYGTEMETYVLVTSNGSSGSGPEWFEVKTKNGVTIEYGRTSDSRFQRTGGSEVLFWRINKMYDQFGNYVVYEYINQDSESRINRIRYTGNFNVQNNQINVEPYNVIQFSYVDRADKNEQFISGAKLKTNTILNKIRIISEGSRFREYRFDYGLNLFSFLKNVTELGATNEDEYNKSHFKYEEKESNQIIENEIDISGLPALPLINPCFSNCQNIVYYPGDFNGDGLTDLLGIQYYVRENGIEARYISWAFYLNRNNESFSDGFEIRELDFPHFWLGNEEHFSHYDRSSIYPVRGFKIMIGDLDGDDIDDIVIGSKMHWDMDHTYYHPFFVTHNILGGGNNVFAVETFPSSSHQIKLQDFSAGSYPPTHKYHVAALGDFDGDGRKEFFGMDLFSQSISIRSFDSRLYIWQQGFSNNSISSPQVLVTDFDGDGTSELILTYNQGGSVGLTRYMDINIENGGASISSWFQQGGILNMTGQVNQLTNNKYVTDFNGDGNQDLVVQDGNQAYIYLSKGFQGHSTISTSSGNIPIAFSPHSYDMIPISQSMLSGRVFFIDVNGDSFTDIINILNGQLKIYYSTGKIINSGQSAFYAETRSYPINNHINNHFNFGDFDGDGNIDMMFSNIDVCCMKVLSLNPSKSTSDVRLSGLKDGLGNVAKFNYYQPIISRGIPSSSSGYPSNLTSGKITAVRRLITNNGVGDEGLNTIDYHFSTGRLNKNGKGFLGFAHCTSTNIITHDQVTSSYTFKASHHILVPNHVTVKRYSDIVSKTTFTYSLSQISGLRFKSTLDLEIKEDFKTGVLITQTNTYDEFGNVLEIVNVVGNSNNETVETSHSFLEYENISGWWASSLLNRSQTSSTRMGEDPLTSVIEYEYHPKGSLKHSIKRADDPYAWSKMAYEYNNFGLPTSIEISGAGISPIISKQYEYSTNGRFSIKQTDMYGFESTFTFNHRWGKVKTATDHLGRQNSYGYDGFGRDAIQIDYLGRETTIERAWVNDSPTYSTCESLTDLCYRKTTMMPNNRFSTVYFNGLRQERKYEWSSQFGDKIKYACYDNLGREISETMPFYDGDLNVRTAATEYDEYNRIQEQTFDVKNSTFNYQILSEGFSVSANSNFNGQNIKTIDPAGRVIKITELNENETVMDYNYFSAGLLKNVELNGIELTSNLYDQHGRQLSLTDNNAGTIVYQYDSFDRIILQIDANNNQLETTYDGLGRIQEIQVSNGNMGLGSYDYEYYVDGNEKFKLKKETAPSGNSTEYTYNDNGNITSITETVDGLTFITSFEYDDEFKLKRKIYPSGFAIRYIYDSKAYLWQITSDDGQLVIWQIDGINANEQITAYQLGNGISVIQEFDVHHYPEIVIGQNQNDELFAFGYEFNPITSNLTHRVFNGIVEEFEYDSPGLNRLTGVVGSEIELYGTETLIGESYTYSDNGNMLSKTGVGNYVYDTQKLNAVDHINWQGGIDEENATQIMLMQTVNYNHFNSVSELINVDNNLKVEFSYGPDDQRRKAEYYVNDISEGWTLEKTRYYIGAYEKQVDTTNIETEVHYISAGGMLVAMYVIEDSIGQYFYPHQDHLGSIIHITDENSEIVYTQSFDAWGRTRNAEDLSYENITERPNWLWRGYTGHEHLDEFGLINMNGRLYDPVIGRMLSPDNYVQSPTYSQSYNRYSYVWNNPLRYTDPSGEFIVATIVGVVIGAYIGGVIAENGQLNPTRWAWDATTWAGIGIGAVVGGAAGYAVAKGVLIVSIGVAVPGGSIMINGTGDDYNLSWTTVAGGGGTTKSSGGSPWINEDGRNAIVQADMNHSYTPLGRELEGVIEVEGIYPEYCWGCVESNAQDALNPSTVGNWLDIYTGPNNPQKYDGRDDFSLLPRNASDAVSKVHDIDYVNLRLEGPMAVFTATSSISADWKFVRNQYEAAALMQFGDPSNAWKGFAAGTAIGMGIIPKTLMYYYGQGVERNMHIHQQYGINSLDLGRSKW